MNWVSIVAIYGLFWVLSAFLVMPFGLRTPDEIDGHEVKEGHADSAPVNFRPGLIVLRASILAAALFAAFYVNYRYEWITVDDINVFGDPPVEDLGY